MAWEAIQSGPTLSASNRNLRLRRAMGVRAANSYLNVNGCKLAWQQLSPGQALQPILCLHDAGSGSREFRPLQPKMSQDCDLLMIDWPGHGRSEALSNFTVETCVADLHAILKQLFERIPTRATRQRPILLASGFASAVAIRYASDHPGTLSGVILCRPAGLLPSSDDLASRKPHQISTARRTLPKWIASLSNLHAQWHAKRVEVLRAAMDSVLAQATRSLNEGQRSLPAALRNVSCPILFALSRESHNFPLEQGLAFLEPLLQASAQHKLTVFSGSFHPLWEDTERFTQAIHTFAQAQLPLALHRHSWLLTAVDWPARNLNLWKCIHPDCPEERILPTGKDANQPPEQTITELQ